MSAIKISKKHKLNFFVGRNHIFSKKLCRITEISIYYISSHIIEL